MQTVMPTKAGGTAGVQERADGGSWERPLSHTPRSRSHSMKISALRCFQTWLQPHFHPTFYDFDAVTFLIPLIAPCGISLPSREFPHATVGSLHSPWRLQYNAERPSGAGNPDVAKGRLAILRVPASFGFGRRDRHR